MSSFRVIPQSRLSESEFDEYPVWSEHYDYDEIEDIERWGLDKGRVLKLFSENSPGNERCVYTLLETNPFPNRMRIFIRASVIDSEGTKLKGYVMNEGAFCLVVFHGGAQFIFSRHPTLGRENQRHERQLLESMGRSSGIFPVTYETEFNDKNGVRIAGKFMYGAAET